jgi:hypothetical protein
VATKRRVRAQAAAAKAETKAEAKAAKKKSAKKKKRVVRRLHRWASGSAAVPTELERALIEVARRRTWSRKSYGAALSKLRAVGVRDLEGLGRVLPVLNAVLGDEGRPQFASGTLRALEQALAQRFESGARPAVAVAAARKKRVKVRGRGTPRAPAAAASNPQNAGPAASPAAEAPGTPPTTAREATRELSVAERKRLADERFFGAAQRRIDAVVRAPTVESLTMMAGYRLSSPRPESGEQPVHKVDRWTGAVSPAHASTCRPAVSVGGRALWTPDFSRTGIPGQSVHPLRLNSDSDSDPGRGAGGPSLPTGNDA